MRKQSLYILCLTLFIHGMVLFQANAATFTVTSTANGGTGTLRQAIIDANATPAADVIQFSIAGAGVHTISLTVYLTSYYCAGRDKRLFASRCKSWGDLKQGHPDRGRWRQFNHCRDGTD